MKLAVVLHDVRSIHNVGSMFRTADAVGAEKIFLCGITPPPFDRLKRLRPDFAKVALGAEHYVAWEVAKDTVATLSALARDGYAIVAVEQSAQAVPYHEVILPADARVALVMGNEVAGLPADVLGEADWVAEIPMRGKKESLNVAVAFGVVAFGLMLGWKK